jgi:RNA polymerase sigma-B factor
MATMSAPAPLRAERAEAPVHESRAAVERELALRYHRFGDLEAREELVRRLMPLARDLALRYRYTNEPVDDLVQVAAMGLLKAIDRFEPGRGAKFTSYAAPTIRGELKRHLRDKGWALHMPRKLQERALAMSRQTEALSKRLGRSPSMEEIADAMGCTSEEVLEAAEAADSYDTASLDAPLASEADGPASLVDLLGREDESFALVETRQAMAEAWSKLPELERTVLGLRLAHDLTQREIGERLGCSQMHVSRLMRRALSRLELEATA